jgi:hypothetical protein
VARYFARRNGYSDPRIDAVGVEFEATATALPIVTHIEDAVSMRGAVSP